MPKAYVDITYANNMKAKELASLEDVNSKLLRSMILEYFAERGLTIPTFEKAMGFVAGEYAEVWDVWLSKDNEFIRNNPENHKVAPEEFYDRIGEELGDLIMMTMIVGIIMDVNPIKSLQQKILRKLKELHQEKGGE